MPTYVYETIPVDSNEAPRRYELWQSMKEDAYTHHPETGEKVRRIVIGGVGMPGSISDSSKKRPPPRRH